MAGLIATAEIDIAAPPVEVWKALIDPDCIKAYFMGATVETDWQAGSTITWSGEYNGRPYEDKGKVVAVEPEKLLVVTHFSPMSGAPDVPESYHTISYRLTVKGGGTHLGLAQDNNASSEEVEHSEGNWSAVLASLKGLVEGRSSR